MMLGRLINRLHRVFDKEPHPVAVVTIHTPCSVTIADGKMVISYESSAHSIDIDTMTLQELVSALSAIGIASTTEAQYQTLSARGILDATRQNTESDNRLYYPQNIFYQEMQTYAWAMQEQSEKMLNGERQLYLHSADGDDLDYWCKQYFGSHRFTSEMGNDDQYRKRIIASILSTSQNNKSLEKALKATVSAYECDVVDIKTQEVTIAKFDGSTSYSGEASYFYEGGYQLGCFHVLTNIQMEDQTPLDDTANKIRAVVQQKKAAGTKMASLVFSATTADTATISDTATITTHDTQPDILPWGLRYDGSVFHNSGRLLTFDGADTYSGSVTYRLAVDGETTYSNEWDSSTATIHTDQADQHQVSIAYNGLASYDGVFDQGATPPPLYDTRMTVTARRHNLFSGHRTYGSSKQYDGSWLADGSTDYQQMRYEGIHTIQEITI